MSLKYTPTADNTYELYDKALYRGQLILVDIPSEDRRFLLRAVCLMYNAVRTETIPPGGNLSHREE